MPQNSAKQTNMQENMLAQAKVLVVDDYRPNVLLLENILDNAGIGEVFHTTDPRQALNIYLQEQPDLVILDLLMPFLDGFAVMEQLRPHVPENSYLPILVITGETSLQVRQQALAAGAADFLTKPFDTIETMLRVQRLIEIASLQRQLQARIARDLHDGPLQDLSAVLLYIENTQRLLNSDKKEAANKSLDQLRQHVLATVGQLRGVVTNMRPQQLEAQSLNTVIHELMTALEQDSLLCASAKIPPDLHLEPELENVIFRLVQESLNNIRKHAAAKNVAIELWPDGDNVQLTISDDGKGFVVQSRLREALATGHVGLAGLYERVNVYGGHLAITSAPGEGTVLKFTLPIKTPVTN